MSVIKRNDNIKIPTCNNTRSVDIISSVGHRFSKQLAKYNITKCPGDSISINYINILLSVMTCHLCYNIVSLSHSIPFYISTFYILEAFCKKAAYNVGLQSFDRLSFINIDEKSDAFSATKKGSTRAIFMYYSTTDIKVSTTSELISLSSFISSIGGNLGLFCGFSFLSSFFYVYRIFQKILRSQKRKNNASDQTFL